MVWHVARIGEYMEILVRKTEGRRPLGMSRCRCEDNIQMDIEEVGYELDSSGSVMDCCEHCNELAGSIKFREFLE
jgi:hypothetical protein